MHQTNVKNFKRNANLLFKTQRPTNSEILTLHRKLNNLLKRYKTLENANKKILNYYKNMLKPKINVSHYYK